MISPRNPEDTPVSARFKGTARQSCIEGQCGDFREKVTCIAQQFTSWVSNPPTEIPQFGELPFKAEDIAFEDVVYHCDGPVYNEDNDEYRCGLLVTTTISDIGGKALANTTFQSEEVINTV